MLLYIVKNITNEEEDTMNEETTKRKNYKVIRACEWAAYICSIIMTFWTANLFVKAYFYDMEPKFFTNVSHFYWMVVTFYASMRQARKGLNPELNLRMGEFFIVFWMIATLIFAVITPLFYKDKLPLFTDLTIQFLVLLSILGITAATKHFLSSFFGKK